MASVRGSGNSMGPDQGGPSPQIDKLTGELLNPYWRWWL
jgi:hypothetical protein